jgi:hypothetical protein
MQPTILRRAILKLGLSSGVAMLVAALSTPTSAAEPPPRAGENRKLGKVRQLVPSVPTVEVAVLESDPLRLAVTAKGQVPTGGWKDIALVRATYADPPADGICDYFLLATAPEGIAAQVITDVSATNTWKGYDEEAKWLKGVRVHGAKGSVVKMIEGSSEE